MGTLHRNESLLGCLLLQKNRSLCHLLIFRIKFFLYSKTPKSLLPLAEVWVRDQDDAR